VISAAQLTRSAGSVNIEWTNNATLELISEYQKHVVLWDSAHKFYKLVNKKNDAWEEIAKEVGISVPEVKKKMNKGRN
jgi:transcription initiation factor IIE alpha subunit